jgi:tyrosyl-tRNA synthetase
MDNKEKLALIEEVGEEIIDKDELIALLKKKKKPIAYDGFEPSGKIHIAQGLLRAINVNKMTKAGFHFKMWVADWHAWANNKMGGDLERIKIVGEYFIEVWKASGMDLKNVEFIWASEAMGKKDYWKTVMNVARSSTLKRILRTTQIMGRSESDNLQASHILYPCMQAADIFYLKADITQLGMDQRKVNVLAREIGPKLGFWKPIIVSHHMLMGLQEPVSQNKDAKERAVELKMSKSKPDTAIFMDDSEEDIKRKLRKAWCPEKKVEDNPILEYCKYIIFEKIKTFVIERPAKFGGTVSFATYSSLENAYTKGEIHPADVKNATGKYINELLAPVRLHFKESVNAKKLLQQVESFKVTR